MNHQTFTRRGLYDLVWSKPLLTLSKEYNISNVGLRKICIRMDIPIPRAGHWTKLKFGKSVSIPTLSKLYTGEDKITLSPRTETGENKKSVDASSLAVVNELKSHLGSKLKVPSKLSSPDKLIIEARESLSRKADSFGHFAGTVQCTVNNLTMRVAPKNVSRALRFMDTLIKTLLSRGHKIVIENNFTYAVIDSQKIKISLVEKHKRVIIKKNNWDTAEYSPTGILSFRIGEYPRFEWKDGKELIEKQLPNILVKLEILGAEKKAREEEWRIHQKEQAEKLRLERIFEERRERDLISFKELLETSSRWHRATNLRNYIHIVQQRKITNNSISQEFQTWLDWANNKADWFDPFIEKEDHLFNKINRNSLTIKKWNY